jgi:hypothetical protein
MASRTRSYNVGDPSPIEICHQRMTAKEYKICVSETPERLASEVTDLLSLGWELYGHPFVSDQGNGHGNGQVGSDDLVCQAMVKRAPVHRSPVLEAPRKTAAPKPAVARPARTPTPISFRNVAAFLAVILGGYLLSEILIFRSGFYARFAEPEASATGSLERTFYGERHRAPSGRKEVLVIGNSRMAEGFSAKLANEYKRDDYQFFNFSVPGATERVWYYMVRDVDPHRDRYAAITLPIDDYDDPDDYEDVADRASEMPLVINRLGLTDILPYTLSFTTWKSRLEVFRGLVLEGVVYQGDFQEFMEHPGVRLQRVKDFWEHGDEYGYSYGGAEHTLAGLQVDWSKRRVTAYPPGMNEDQKRDTDSIFRQPIQRSRVRDFQVRWLGAMVDLYRGSKTRFIVFQVPRSPVSPPSRAHLPWTIIDELRKHPWVTVVDRHTFEDLERPELFADLIHLNADGRKLFSPRLAEVVKASVH